MQFSPFHNSCKCDSSIISQIRQRLAIVTSLWPCQSHASYKTMPTATPKQQKLAIECSENPWLSASRGLRGLSGRDSIEVRSRHRLKPCETPGLRRYRKAYRHFGFGNGRNRHLCGVHTPIRELGDVLHASQQSFWALR